MKLIKWLEEMNYDINVVTVQEVKNLLELSSGMKKIAEDLKNRNLEILDFKELTAQEIIEVS